ncbi:hypothetical protein SAMD00023353_3500390 [Rosellinia necatrix]|uniref:Uncharacterized protein n=1 Tax=Rosellinia necatrix TaxID=77044 RepID=A0A1S8A9Z6_ROSNE|nr:hypothetical protein SAMD00023353_3500390 [Rosellinia necatrix]
MRVPSLPALIGRDAFSQLWIDSQPWQIGAVTRHKRFALTCLSSQKIGRKGRARGWAARADWGCPKGMRKGMQVSKACMQFRMD